MLSTTDYEFDFTVTLTNMDGSAKGTVASSTLLANEFWYKGHLIVQVSHNAYNIVH